MPNLAYHINKKASEEGHVLVIDVGEKPSIYVPYRETLAFLKELKGPLYFNGKQIVCDFYGKNALYYQVEEVNGVIKITARVKTSLHDFNLQDCDFICPGPPAWFIKDISLKIFTETPWSAIKNGLNGNLSYEDIQDEHIVFIGNAKEVLKHAQTPLPVLMLKDRTGAFADLWMDYGHGKRVAFHELHQRDLSAEMAWERDLLETGYVKKPVGTSHYYCPMDKIPKTLGFLLELGWRVQDWQGNRLVMMDKSYCTAETLQNAIHVKGKLKFDAYEADLTRVAGAFNRKERFLQLAPLVVALLPNLSEDSGLCQVFEEGEIIGDAIQLPRSRLGMLSQASSDKIEMLMDASLEKLSTSTHMDIALPSAAFQGALRPYQQEGVNWLAFLYEVGFHGLLADDMGLGKTVQVLAFLSRLEMKHPILIVLPTSLLFNWRKEIERFLPNASMIVHHGPERTTVLADLQKPQFVLTSYATLRLDLELLSAIAWQCVILDEAQVIKNAHTMTAQAVCRLKSRFRLSLTGTPVENHLNELWSHFHFLLPELFDSEQDFENELAAGASDSRYLKRIKKKIRPFILRRKKEEVAQDLPEKIEQVVWIEMTPSQRQVYDSFLSGVRGNLLKKVEVDGVSKHRIEILEAILRLRQICCHPALVSTILEDSSAWDSGKLNSLLQDIETVVEEGQKVLVYSQFTSMLQLISKEMKSKGYPFVYLDGSTIDREKVVTQFQEDPSIKLFLISLKAGGIGLNLTAADYVFLYDPWWNEAAENQAIDRVHRIGKKNTVFAKRYVTRESIEEKMMSLKAHKRSTIGEIFDAEWESTPMTLQDLAFMLGQ